MKRQTIEEISEALDCFETKTVLASHDGRRLVARTTHYADGREPYTFYEAPGVGTMNLRVAISYYCDAAAENKTGPEMSTNTP